MSRRRRVIGIRLFGAAVLGALISVAAATIAFGLDLDGEPHGALASRAANAAPAAASPVTAAQAAASLAAGAKGAACGPATAATVAAVDAVVARRIYAQELGGAETRLNAARVAGFGPLLDALARNDQAGVRSAVHELVYTPHWHIVRVRVSRGGRVLADVGGPYILAPVSGTLRAHGRKLGSFTMSVQDDLGYVKLVTRFIGAPIDIYRQGRFVMGTLRPPPAVAPDASHVSAGGRGYLTSALSVHAFPSGPLSATLFVPDGQSGQSCAAVRLAAWGSVARHVAARFHPLSAHLRDLADVLRTVTNGRVLIRSGSRTVVGGGPRRLPSSGKVRYAGRSWLVYSWQPLPGVRVYFLTPPA